MRRRRRICLTRSSTGAGTDTAASPRPHSRPDPSSASWTRSPCASGARAGAGSRRVRARRWCNGQWRLLSGLLLRERSCLGRNYRSRRRDDGSRIRNGRAKPHVLKAACGASAARASTTTACGTRSPTAQRRLSIEAALRGGQQDEEKNQRMCKKRGGDSLPPPLSLAWYSYRRPIAPFYAAGSFGDMPMTLTPAPRATSIAKITSEYLTLGSPLTKMIFSGRPS